MDNPQRYLVPLIPLIWYYLFAATGRLLASLRSQVLMRKPGYRGGVVLAPELLVGSLLITDATMADRATATERGREG
jgi:hypothetical protein